MLKKTYILGAGMTGLSAGYVSGLPIFEAQNTAGGICSSYYLGAGQTKRMFSAPADGEAYRFEIGGGHWVFGGDAGVNAFIKKFCKLNTYARRSSVYFPDRKLFVPYPIQNNLRFLEPKTAAQSINEMNNAELDCKTMQEWLIQSFGPTLCKMFFSPFHKLYTAGLYDQIAPQDPYKSPVDIKHVIQGVLTEPTAVGYNAHFTYPVSGLDGLAQRLAQNSDVRFGNRVVHIDLQKQIITFENGETLIYDVLLSTLPLNKVVEMANLSLRSETAPYSSVLVLNIGAFRGENCPDDHWLYVPKSNANFHRVGFYSNVDKAFLPKSCRSHNNRVSIYVERAFKGGRKPTAEEQKEYAASVVKELQNWRFIKDAEVVDPTWIDVAYTWSMPQSNWKQEALDELEKYSIFQTGRYGRWTFNGIAASIREGLVMGAAFKSDTLDKRPA